jgi:hypothetical protein
MKPMHGTTISLLLCAQLALPSIVSAQSTRQEGAIRRSFLDAPAAEPEAAAAQSAPLQKRSSRGERLLRSTFIGAAIGVGVVMTFGHMLSDCGCGSTSATDVFSGALYGGLIGAAVGSVPARGPLHPSRHPTSRRSTPAPRIGSVSVAIRF